MRVSADAPEKITVSAWIDRPQDATTEVAGNDRLNLVGALGGGKGLSFLASVKILADGGNLEAFPERIYAERANAVTFVVAAATSFRGTDHRAAVERTLSAAAATPYDRLKSDHVADHQKLFRRVALHLGSHEGTQAQGSRFVASMATDDRLERVKKGEKRSGLESLYFQFGRYLLIASSRPGWTSRQPAGAVERQHVPAVGQRLSPQYQPADELLAGRGHQSGGAASTAVRLPRVAPRAGPERPHASITARRASSPITSAIFGGSRRQEIVRAPVSGLPARRG